MSVAPEHGQPSYETDDWPSRTLGNFPLARESVHGTYRYFWSRTHAKQEQADLLAADLTACNTIIGDFCHDRIYPEAYNAAMLAPIASCLNDIMTNRVALRALQHFTSEPELHPGDTEYTLGLLGDRPVIDSFWEAQVLRLYSENTQVSAIIRSRDLKAPLPAESWSPGPPLKDEPLDKVMGYFSELGALNNSQRVNLASFVVDAAENFAWLASDKAVNSVETYQRVLRAEILSAPVLTALGLDGMSSGLRSVCNILRLENSDNGQFVEQARQRLAKIGSPEEAQRRVLAALELAIGENVSQAIIGQRGEHGIVVGEALCDAREFGLARVNWRVKALGNDAVKFWQYSLDPRIPEGSLPTDEIASTVILKDPEVMAPLFLRAYNRVRAHKDADLVPSPSRADSKMALYATGPGEFIDIVKNVFSEHGTRLEDVAVVNRKLGFRAVKLTLQIDGVGHELMFMGDRERHGNRITDAPHALMKLIGEIPPAADISAATRAFGYIHTHREVVATNALTAPSRQCALTLLAAINNAS